MAQRKFVVSADGGQKYVDMTSAEEADFEASRTPPPPPPEPSVQEKYRRLLARDGLTIEDVKALTIVK